MKFYLYCGIIVFMIFGVYYTLQNEILALHNKNLELEKKIAEVQMENFKVSEQCFNKNIGVKKGW